MNERTAKDWDWGVKKSRSSRTYADGRRVDYAAATVTMCGVTTPLVGLSALDKQLHPRFLALAERERIRDLRAAGQSLRAIGRALGRPASTVKREIDANSGAEGYQPYAAHRAAAARRPRPKERKLLREGRLRRFVQDGLRRRWSPEQICHALRKEHPDDESMRVSVETVYQALYFQARGGLKREVQAAIRSGRTRRRPRQDPQRRTPRFIDPMVMISDRPADIEDRAVPGHWEGDLIIGAGGRSAIATLVERSTRYTMLVHLPGGTHDAETVRDGLVTTIQTLPAHLRGSLTWDQGSEMARHKQFTMATDMPVYFCDPASPWQRGSNENTNGLLRQYFPKGTDLSVHSPEDLEHVAQELNGRPRKTLGWDTPAERLRDLLTT
ncbi:IS30 family transposase [Streptomyces sp. HNS054]|uniref:IS30 family transposase n=2 Tax=Streptomyces TaxID=1883 RepID=UPI003B6330E5